jgi:hypothetical protein
MYAKQKRSTRRWHGAGAQRQQQNDRHSFNRTRPATLLDFHRASNVPGTRTSAFAALVFNRASYPHFLSAAINGDRTAAAALDGLHAFVERYKDKPAGQGALCMTCDHEFIGSDKPLVFAICVPALALAPTATVVSAICPTCAQKPDLLDLITADLRRIWPDAEPHPMVSQ